MDGRTDGWTDEGTEAPGGGDGPPGRAFSAQRPLGPCFGVVFFDLRELVLDAWALFCVFGASHSTHWYIGAIVGSFFYQHPRNPKVKL